MQNKYFEDAILFEEKGYALYTQLAKETKNKLTEKLFTSLAEQEKYHIEYIRKYTAKKEIKKISFDPLEAALKSLYVTLDKNMRGKDLSQVTGLEQALEMERAGYRLYQEASNSAETNNDREFFTYLMSMEKEHYEALANLYYYYTSNDQWLSEDESKTWNWMNL